MDGSPEGRWMKRHVFDAAFWDNMFLQSRSSPAVLLLVSSSPLEYLCNTEGVERIRTISDPQAAGLDTHPAAATKPPRNTIPDTNLKP